MLHLLSPSDIARTYGISRPSATDWTTSPAFPKPAAAYGLHRRPLWTPEDVARFVIEHKPRRADKAREVLA